MSTFNDFDQGDTVAHVYLGDGVVTSKTASLIKVVYKRKASNRQPIVGTYGPAWFQSNPGLLFHRSKVNAD